MKKLFTTVTVLICCISLFGQKGTSVTKPNSLIADIDWSMHPRYVPVSFTNATNIVTGYNRGLHKYIDEYVNPHGFGVTLRVILKNQKIPTTITYKWVIEGITKENQSRNEYRDSITTRKKCLFAGSATVNDVDSDCETIHLLPSTGTYRITITASVLNSKEVSVFEKIIQLKDYLIVAIGDSFTSGEGNPDVKGVSDDERFCDLIKFSQVVNGLLGSTYDMKKEAVWLEPLAHRSFYSPSSMVAKMMEETDPHSSVTFLNFGASGAKITSGLLTPQHPEWQRTGQIEEAQQTIRNRHIDALIMSIGINDLGGASGGISSLLGEAADPTPPEFFESPIVNEAFRQIERLPNLYNTLNNQIKTKLNPVSVFIYEIPVNIFRNTSNTITKPCGALSYIDLEDAIIIDRIGVELNMQEQLAALNNNWTYLGGIVNAFKGHGYCESSDKAWYRAASTSCKIQGDINGTIHPNETGHRKIAELAYPVIWFRLNPIPVSVLQAGNKP
jgi:lysophospholipase L1-like esterase